VDLPASWKGYSIITDRWVGYDASTGTQREAASGPLISVRYPRQARPRQDIPIMVFTVSQWNDMNADKWHIGAAPLNPSELARNATYVFGLPARYNYAFLEGWEEVQGLIDGGAVRASKPCTPRPACLDATPRCLLPEPAEGWCT
jgi:hypothetical protein